MGKGHRPIGAALVSVAALLAAVTLPSDVSARALLSSDAAATQQHIDAALLVRFFLCCSAADGLFVADVFRLACAQAI